MGTENYFARQAVRYENEYKQSCSELLGIAEGLIADAVLNDAEIRFLKTWLEKHDAASCEWPVDLILKQVQDVLADGVVTDDERSHLLQTLRMLIGGRLNAIAEAPRVTELALDIVERVTIPGSLFCLTGEFVYAPRERCCEEIAKRGGIVKNSVTKKLNYLLVGGLGSEEWKHGSYGTKIIKAMDYKRDGCALKIVHEDVWAASL